MVVILIIGVIFGLIISGVIDKTRLVGTLRIDNSDPTDKPYMFLEIKRGVGDISKRNFVVLQVKREDFIPHE